MKGKKLNLVLVGCFWKASEEERSISDSMLLLRCLRYVRNAEVAECFCVPLFFCSVFDCKTGAQRTDLQCN